MKNVVKKEVLKLLDAGVIFLVFDSKLVSPVQYVTKNEGMIVFKNDKKELTLSRVTMGRRMCINYRKLNNVNRNDYFPLPFINEMLDRLAGHSYFCFLDGYLGYNQILIALGDQHKTAFTCPFGTFAYNKIPFGLCNAPRMMACVIKCLLCKGV